MTRVLTLALAVWASLTGLASAAPRHVVLVTIDGLRPEFYLDQAWEAPALRALMQAGSYARAAEPVFPTVTYPNHASIASGVRPAVHGVVANIRVDPTGEHARWYADAADLRSPPIWQWAGAAGLSTAAVSWPSTVGADIDALVPEQDYFARSEPLALLLASSTPGLLERLGVTPAADVFQDVARWDAFVADTAATIMRMLRPRLLLVHLVETDYRQHRTGLDTPETRMALQRVDTHVAAIVRAVRDAGLTDRTAIIVTGDHGFAAVEHLVFPNAVLVRAGLRGCPRPGDAWVASVHIAGAAGAVYVNPPGAADAIAKAEAALRAESSGRYLLISREQLDRLGAFPGAAFALEGAPGFALSGSCDRGLVGTARGGAHGYLPTRPGMATGFIAAGAGVRRGVVIERVRLIDVAPTVARLLGIASARVEGRPIEALLP